MDLLIVTGSCICFIMRKGGSSQEMPGWGFMTLDMQRLVS